MKGCAISVSKLGDTILWFWAVPHLISQRTLSPWEAININCYTMAPVSSGQQVVKGHHEQSDVGYASANVIEAPLSNDHR